MNKWVFVLLGLEGAWQHRGRRLAVKNTLHPALFHPCRFQKLHLACGSEHLILRSPFQPQLSLCEAPASPLQLPGGNVTITYSYAGARAPMGQGFLLSYSQGELDRAVQGAAGRGSASPREGVGNPTSSSASQPLSMVPLQIG